MAAPRWICILGLLGIAAGCGSATPLEPLTAASLLTAIGMPELEFNTALQFVPSEPSTVAGPLPTAPAEQILVYWQIATVEPPHRQQVKPQVIELMSFRRWQETSVPQPIEYVPLADDGVPFVAIAHDGQALNTAIREKLNLWAEPCIVTIPGLPSCVATVPGLPYPFGGWFPLPAYSMTPKRIDAQRFRVEFVGSPIVAGTAGSWSSLVTDPFVIELDEGESAIIPLTSRDVNVTTNSASPSRASSQVARQHPATLMIFRIEKVPVVTASPYAPPAAQYALPSSVAPPGG